MAIESLRALEKASENKDIFEVVLDSDCTDRGVSREASLEKMHALYAAIRRAQEGYDPALHSASGMVGGDGAKMREYVQKGKTIWRRLYRSGHRAGTGNGRKQRMA